MYIAALEAMKYLSRGIPMSSDRCSSTSDRGPICSWATAYIAYTVPMSFSTVDCRHSNGGNHGGFAVIYTSFRLRARVQEAAVRRWFDVLLGKLRHRSAIV